jgi:transcriptional regulator with XRE-family HTH domain
MDCMERNDRLADFLRTRRAAIDPERIGLYDPTPRRVPGLRREELAALAGVSVDYYTRLEQGRPITPSQSVLDALADALLLDPAERDYLQAVASRPPSARRARSRRCDPESTRWLPGSARPRRSCWGGAPTSC